MSTNPQLSFYSQPTPMTDLEPDGRARSVDEILATARGVILHEHLTALYGQDRPADRNEELMQRSAQAIVDLAGGLDEREPAERVLGNCRQFTVLTVALLRQAGVAARARCGFGSAFEPGKFVDHWIVEHFDGDRWVRSDCQLDPLQQELFGHDFDALDLPDGVFLSGGEAWQRCRRGEADPDTFGINDMWGLWFVQGNVVADLAALNKVEMLPWDDWGIRSGPEDGSEPEILLDRVDEVATVCASDDLDAVQALYAAPDLAVPATVQSWYVGGGRIDDVSELVGVPD